eukprot:TRINITY_DN53884_c1_g2_i1.p1 TRINITY_DN53884_c1_g2~~TRINITY_DN53884_c1_g2_i1.p1  ORF type:complete len:513 (-),score=43.83 TRINITY_DN53884_c1_g2_i1:21-1559(-)
MQQVSGDGPADTPVVQPSENSPRVGEDGPAPVRAKQWSNSSVEHALDWVEALSGDPNYYAEEGLSGMQLPSGTAAKTSAARQQRVHRDITPRNSFNSWREEFIQHSGVREWAEDVTLVPVSHEVGSAAMSSREFSENGNWQWYHHHTRDCKVMFLGGPSTPTRPYKPGEAAYYRTSTHLRAQCASLYPQMKDENQLLPLDWVLNKKALDYWDTILPEDRQRGVQQSIQRERTIQQHIALLQILKGQHYLSEYEVFGALKGKADDTSALISELQLELDLEEAVPIGEWTQWMYNGLCSHPNRNHHRRALMCARWQGWHEWRKPRWTGSNGRYGYQARYDRKVTMHAEADAPVVAPPEHEAHKEVAHQRHHQHKNHTVPSGDTHELTHSMQNTHDFLLPICILTIPEDWDLNRINIPEPQKTNTPKPKAKGKYKTSATTTTSTAATMAQQPAIEPVVKTVHSSSLGQPPMNKGVPYTTGNFNQHHAKESKKAQGKERANARNWSRDQKMSTMQP